MSSRETDDNYDGLVVGLNPRWRVIRCRNAIQWIVQRRKAGAGARWEARSHVRFRRDLFTSLTRLKIEIPPHARAVLDALPDRIERKAA